MLLPGRNSHAVLYGISLYAYIYYSLIQKTAAPCKNGAAELIIMLLMDQPG